MQYALLIYGPDSEREARSGEEHEALMRAHRKLIALLQERGKHLGGQALEPASTATSVRVRDGQTLVTDGPFAETREHLGGFYLVEADDLEEAISYAERLGEAMTGTIEVRPIWKV